MATTTNTEKRPGLPLWLKSLYGTCELGIAGFNTLRQIFYAIFVTDVVGLAPGLASIAIVIGVVWDAINDPLVGTLSDRLNTRWGKRRPFMALFAIPFGLVFLALWWAPPIEQQGWLMVYVLASYMLSDTMQTLVTVPYYSLTPAMTSDYDERTALTSFRMGFNLFASLATAVAAPMIVDSVAAAGGTQQQGYLLMAGIFGLIGAVPFLTTAIFARETVQEDQVGEERSVRETLKTAKDNVPFRYATAIYVLNWITVDLVSLMLPYFLTYWVARGQLQAQMTIAGMNIAIESVILGVLLLTAFLALPLWTWLSRRLDKRIAYIIGMSSWFVVQLLLITVQPQQTNLILIFTALAGIGVSAAHVLPDAIFPDVIEWDELHTGHRNEGIYYGTKNFLRKATSAIATFIALQALGAAGYQAPPDGAAVFMQSDTTLAVIRMLTGPAGAVLLVGAIATAWIYPLNRRKHARMQMLLQRRRERRARRRSERLKSA